VLHICHSNHVVSHISACLGDLGARSLGTCTVRNSAIYGIFPERFTTEYLPHNCWVQELLTCFRPPISSDMTNRLRISFCLLIVKGIYNMVSTDSFFRVSCFQAVCQMISLWLSEIRTKSLICCQKSRILWSS
jgi:hypothetical protein